MRISRVLLTLTLSLLIVMPWTEHFCNWDHFLRGGQDIELSLLAVLIGFCLVLLLFQQGRVLLSTLLALRSFLFAFFRPPCLVLPCTQGRSSALPNVCTGVSPLPLRI